MTPKTQSPFANTMAKEAAAKTMSGQVLDLLENHYSIRPAASMGKQFLAGKTSFYNDAISEIEAVVSVIRAAECAGFNTFGQYSTHWADGTAGTTFWLNAVSRMHNDQVAISQYAQRVNHALGGVASIYLFEGTFEDAMMRFNAEMGVIDVPATKPAVPADSENTDVALGRKPQDTPAEAKPEQPPDAGNPVPAEPETPPQAAPSPAVPATKSDAPVPCPPGRTHCSDCEGHGGFDGVVCETCGGEGTRHWITDDNERKGFWADCGSESGRHKTGMNQKTLHEYVHQALGVQHIEELSKTRQEALDLVKEALDRSHPIPKTADEIAKDMWKTILPEFKELRPGLAKDGNDAIAMILAHLGWKSMKDAIAQFGTESVRKFWDESKSTLPTTKQEPPQQPPAEKRVEQPPAAERKVRQFRKAEKKHSKARILIGGIPGGGKTFTALQIARSMCPTGKVALIDSEAGSAEKFADDFDFDVLELDDFSPEDYIDAIHTAEAEGYDVLIVDSMTHEWGYILDVVDDYKLAHPTKEGKDDTRAAWRIASPRHRALVDAILHSKIHVIATVRANTKKMAARDENRQPTTQNVVTSFVQRKDLPYDFDIVLNIGEGHVITSDKSRCHGLDGYRGVKAGVEIGQIVSEWLKLVEHTDVKQAA